MNTKFTEEFKQRSKDVSFKVIGAAMEVHRQMGPGLLEGSYEECLCRELSQRCIPFTRQVAVPLVYKGVRLEGSLRLDMLVADLVIVEIKAVEAVLPVHQAQLLTYLKHSDLWLGLLINFNVPILKVGLTRMLNG
jgi:GxxExxY protein